MWFISIFSDFPLALASFLVMSNFWELKTQQASVIKCKNKIVLFTSDCALLRKQQLSRFDDEEDEEETEVRRMYCYCSSRAINFSSHNVYWKGIGRRSKYYKPQQTNTKNKLSR